MKKCWLLFCLCLWGWSEVNAQRMGRNYPDTLNTKKLAWTAGVTGLTYVGGMSFLGWVWYSDVPRVPFHWYNDNAGYLQMDKMGHAYAAYGQSLLGYQALRRAGLNRNAAIWWGGSIGFFMQLPIEIFDGLYQGWGFSWGDVVANTAGSALVMGQEWLFDEQFMRFKFSFWRSTYAEQAHGYLGQNYFESLFYDYNGHTYWLSAPISR
ncbi:MAG: DUF2279 domain-containing protein, partial [Bacteroidota bacterium]